MPSKAFLGIALVEELAKFTAIVLVAHRRQDFGRMMDGVAYGVCLALGFALPENILHMIGAKSIRQTAILIIFTAATPLHVLTNGLMGFSMHEASYMAKGESLYPSYWPLHFMVCIICC